MSVRLTDFIDPNRPLAKAALEMDWTTIVALFPDAGLDGMDAPKIWILASLIILGEVTGLSEGEVLSRWPENPYWQSFSGFAQFQWKTPVNQADCLAFRRYVDVARAAKLSEIAQSILNSKTLETNIPSLPTSSSASVGEALALRQVHFLAPQPAQPYKAPPRSSFQTNIKQLYARSAATAPKAEEPPAQDPSTSPAPSATDASKQDSAKKEGPTTTSTTTSTTPAPSPAKPEAESTPSKESPHATPSADAPAQGAPQDATEKKDAPEIPETPVVQQFAQTYGPLIQKTARKAALLGGDGFMGNAPAAIRQSSPTGAPEFDTTAPFMKRAAPGEPVKMEVVVTGSEPLQYQWETFDDVKGTAVPIDGCTEPHLTIALEPSDSMLAFQCRVSNAAYPQGAVSRTFFVKKNTSPQTSAGSSGDKLAPKSPTPAAPQAKTRR